MITVNDICQHLETIAPLGLQEAYDNSGLIIGNRQAEATGALICFDVTEAVIDEAIARKCNVVIAHHPLIFKGLKSITGRDYIERCVIKAIKHDIALYAGHTNFDSIKGGVSFLFGKMLGLNNMTVLAPKSQLLVKLVTFVPEKHLNDVREALFAAGAGHIGEYDACSFSHAGLGTFRAGEAAHPFCGAIGELHSEKESRLEVILPRYLCDKVTEALMAAHPYEEPAYDLISLENHWRDVGLGVVGSLENPVDEIELLQRIKSLFNVDAIRHSPLLGRKIARIALCGGSGAEFIADAKRAGADLYITADVKYHQFFEHENRILIADVGHFESEQQIKLLFLEQLKEKFPNFAVYLSEAELRQMQTF